MKSRKKYFGKTLRGFTVFQRKLLAEPCGEGGWAVEDDRVIQMVRNSPAPNSWLKYLQMLLLGCMLSTGGGRFAKSAAIYESL
jgi:hypothetical protein